MEVTNDYYITGVKTKMRNYPYLNTKVELQYYYENNDCIDVYETIELNLETINSVLNLNDDINLGLSDCHIVDLYTGLMVFVIRFRDLIDDELKSRIFNVIDHPRLNNLRSECWLYLIIFDIYPEKHEYIVNKLLTKSHDLGIILQLIAVKPDLRTTERNRLISTLNGAGLKYFDVKNTNLKWFLEEFPELIMSDVILQSTIFKDEFNIVINMVHDFTMFFNKLIELANDSKRVRSGQKQLIELAISIATEIDLDLGLKLLVGSSPELELLNIDYKLTHKMRMLVKSYAFASSKKTTMMLWRVIADVTRLDEVQNIIRKTVRPFANSTAPKTVDFLNYLLSSDMPTNVLLEYMLYSYGSPELDNPTVWTPLVVKILNCKPQLLMNLLENLPHMDSNLKHLLLNKIITNWSL